MPLPTASLDYLAARGARPSPDGGFDFGDPAREWRAAREGAAVTDAADWGLLGMDGEDAETFLQGQLSNDVKALAPGRGQWTSFNSPKGRMLATLFLFRRAEGAAPRYGALVAADLAAPIARRLAMFVLRSKVALADATAAHRVIGIGGPRAADAVAEAFEAVPARGATLRANDADVLQLPDGRFLAIVATDRAGERFDAVARHATPVGSDVWRWLGVASGIPMVTSATQDLFVAQTANWDAIGGVDFRKGCYTGQEIVARMQYLGRLKERMYVFASDAAPPAPGTRLYGTTFGDQASGTVVNSAPAPGGGSVFLAVVQTAAAEAGTMSIGAPQGPQAVRGELPYALPAPPAPRVRA